MSTSAEWEALKQCKPKLAPSVEYESRTEREQSWLLLRNTVTGEHVRLNASAVDFIALVDGTKTLENLFVLGDELGFSMDDINALIGPLCASGMLILGQANESERLLDQHGIHKNRDRKSRFSNPLAIKIPLLNPDKWLGVIVDNTQRLLGWWLLVTILSVMVVAVAVGIANHQTIANEFLTIASSPTHWWLYGLLYPLLKAVHEIAHAVLIKRWGGSVHEMGITFLVLMPIPYVDASDVWMFPEKRQRILVGAAGMLAECTLASIGLFLFLTVQPGYTHDVGFALFVMGSLSTILFNANPLLKFDGYYILQDIIDMPNLATRAAAYCRYLFKKYVYRVASAESPVKAKGERAWLLTYGILAMLYRCVITVVIALFLASQFLLLGVMLALFALFQLLIKPVLKLSHYLRESPELAGIRQRTVGLTCAAALIGFLLVGFLPMPSSTRAEGVVWVPNQAQVFATQEGVVDELLVESGEHVQVGQLLFRLRAPELQTELHVTQAELDAAYVSYRKLQQLDTAKAQALASEIVALESELAVLHQKVAELDIVAQNSGQFFIDQQSAVAGRYVDKGALLAYVVDKGNLVVKAVLAQQRVERLQAGVQEANVRLANDFSHQLSATLTRQTPAALNTLPSPSLAYNGRGGIAVASDDANQLKTLERVFHIELALPEKANTAGIGGKAYVTLHHQPESLGKRWWRSTRQLLLKQLTV